LKSEESIRRERHREGKVSFCLFHPWIRTCCLPSVICSGDVFRRSFGWPLMRVNKSGPFDSFRVLHQQLSPTMSSLSFQTDVRKMVACFLELLLSWEEGDLGDVLLAVIFSWTAQAGCEVDECLNPAQRSFSTPLKYTGLEEFR